MAKNQKKYTQEFKQQIVDMYNTGTKSFPQLELEYGVTMSGWVKQLSPVKVSDNEVITAKEYKALQKRLRILKSKMKYYKKLLPYSQKNDK